MNRELKKTAIFAGAAAALVLLAILTKPSPRAAEVFADQGQEFYPAFKDPGKASALEVIDYDELAGTPDPFKVQLVNGQWSIPSHNNYPADGKDRLAKTAATVMDLKKERVASEDPKMHEEYRVVDPLDPKAKGTKGRGKRVRLFDASGTVLADYIFGKETQDGSGHVYVRIPEQKRTYAIKAKPEVSTKFEDWVETDLLQLSAPTIRKVVIDKYSVDLIAQAIKDRSTHFLVRDDSSAPWKVSELKEDKEEVNTETVTTLTSTLGALKLSGVRPKPPLIAREKDLSELAKLPRLQFQVLAQELGAHGFYVVPEGQGRFGIVSSEGEVQVSCDDGVVYTLRFGDVLVGMGQEVSAGKDKKDEKKDDKKDEKKPEDKKGGIESENRYLFLSARWDESLLGAAPAEPKPYVADPAKKPEDQKADEDKAKKDKAEYETKKQDWEKKKDDGKKRAAKLAARFADWYYVIPAEAFKKLRVARTQLVKAKEAPPKDEKKPEHDHEKDKKPDEKKPEDGKKPDEKKPEEKKPDEKKAEEKKPEEKPKAPEEKKPEDKPKPADEKKP